jgi:hypothetical protein
MRSYGTRNIKNIFFYRPDVPMEHYLVGYLLGEFKFL